MEAAGELDTYDPTRSLHVGQSQSVHEPLQPGPTRMIGRVRSVYDKLHRTIVHIDVVASSFDAGYTILLRRPGRAVPGLGADLDRNGTRRA